MSGKQSLADMMQSSPIGGVVSQHGNQYIKQKRKQNACSTGFGQLALVENK
jgi:hypothetical protein